MNYDQALIQAEAFLNRLSVPGITTAGLAEVLCAGSPRRLAAHDPLCVEGEPGDAMYFLLEGSIRVQRRDPHGRLRDLARMAAPCMVGQMALVDHSPRSASCVADDRCFLIAIDRAVWLHLQAEPSVRGSAMRRVVLSSLCSQLAGANAKVRELMGGGPELVVETHGQADDLLTLPDTALQPLTDDESEEVMRLSGLLDGWTSEEPRT
jgi:CRP-like cAMP-binding protein